MSTRKSLAYVAVATLLYATPLVGQTQREDLIRQGRESFEDTVALKRFFAASDPALGASDSLWVVANEQVAETLRALDRGTLANVWLRLVARHGRTWSIDPVRFLPETVTAYGAAADSVDATTDMGTARTSWQWPTEFDATARGTVRATASDPGVAASVSVEGAQGTQSGESLSLPPGTYTLVVSAEGYEPVRVAREILPGVTTLLEADMLPLLPVGAENAAAGRVVRISYTLNGQEVCRNGLIAGSDGLVLTTLSSVRDARSLRVSALNGRQTFSDVLVVKSDPEKDLAVLKLDTMLAVPLRRATGVTDGQYAWSVHFSGCDDLATARTRLTSWQVSPGASADLMVPVPANSIGAPLIDREGMFVGLIQGTTTVVPAASTEGILEDARRQIVAQLQPQSGGGFPWKWVSAGAAAVGLAAVLSGGGGGDGGGTNSGPPAATTGSITVTFNR